MRCSSETGKGLKECHSVSYFMALLGYEISKCFCMFCMLLPLSYPDSFSFSAFGFLFSFPIAWRWQRGYERRRWHRSQNISTENIKKTLISNGARVDDIRCDTFSGFGIADRNGNRKYIYYTVSALSAYYLFVFWWPNSGVAVHLIVRLKC